MKTPTNLSSFRKSPMPLTTDRVAVIPSSLPTVRKEAERSSPFYPGMKDVGLPANSGEQAPTDHSLWGHYLG